jgi:nucleotide-binding universal stress UspA family protein
MFKRVVVPLDGSPLAEGIIPFILQIAGPLDLEVTLVRVVNPVPPTVIEASRQITVEDVEGRMRQAREYLAPIAAELAAKGTRATAEARHGETVDEIVAAARDARADLIAMTTHGRGGLGRVLFGSVAEAVLKRAHLPVFLLRLTEKEVKARTAAGKR